jgi:hypothetical protein
LVPGCKTHTEGATLSEIEAENVIQTIMKERVWPDVEVVPTADGGFAEESDLSSLDSTLAQSPLDIVAGQVSGNCAALAAGGAGATQATTNLANFITVSVPIDETELADQISNGLQTLRAFSAYFEVDLLQLLESPTQGPDVAIFNKLPHYPIARQDIIDLGNLLAPFKPGEMPTTPAVINSIHQTAADWVAFLMDLHKADLSTEIDTLVFVATWLPIDPNRYEYLANHGLPRFGWIADLNDMYFDQGNAIWANWTLDNSPVAKVAMGLSQLTSDLQTVQSSWRSQAGSLVDASSPASAASSLCANAMTIASAVATSAPSSLTTPEPIGTLFHGRLSDVFQLAQLSNDPEISGAVPMPAAQ